jgi:hypothetical protein
VSSENLSLLAPLLLALCDSDDSPEAGHSDSRHYAAINTVSVAAGVEVLAKQRPSIEIEW